MKMMKEVVSIGVGAVIGGYAVYKFNDYIKVKQQEGDKKQAEEKIILKNVDELFNNQVVVDFLDGKELAKWFRANIELATSGVTQVVAYPTESVLMGLGYEFNDEINTERNLLQFFYNEGKGEILKIRNIGFSSIDEVLRQLLEDNEGMAIIEQGGIL